MQSEFEKAAESVKGIVDKMSDNEKLEVYGLYKQGTIGDVNTSRPGMFDLKGKAKWDAWDKCKGISTQQAQNNYVQLVNSLLSKYQ